MTKNNQKGFVHILVFIILLVGLVAGVYLVQRTQIFKPKAYDTSGSPIEGFTQGPGCDDGTPESQCSLTKPKYCVNGQLVNMCSTCGCDSGTCLPDGTCKQDSANCKPLIISGESYVNGDHKSKIDIVFIQGYDGFPDRKYDEEAFKSMIKNYVDTLFSYDPIDKNKYKFNIYYVLENAKNCKGLSICELPPSLSECDFADVKAVVYPNIILSESAGYSVGAYLVAGGPPQMFIHELGHNLFRLSDEYYPKASLGSDRYPYPNTFETKEKCEAYVKEQNLDSGCEQICRSGSLPNNGGILCKDVYRVSGSSIMYFDLKTLNIGSHFSGFSENNKLRIKWFFNNYETILNNKIPPKSQITSPPKQTIQTTDFEVYVSDNNPLFSDESPSSGLKCWYRVDVSGKTSGETKSRECNSHLTVTVGSNGICSPDESAEYRYCDIYVGSTNSAGLTSRSMERYFIR